MLHRMRELAVQGINDTNGTQDRAYLQLEVDALMEEINRVASDTQYNGSAVLNGNLTNDYTGNSVEVGGIAISGGSTFTISVNGGAAVTVTADATPSATNLTSDTNAASGISGITVTADGSNWKFAGSGLTSLKVNSTEVKGTPTTVGGNIQVGTEANQSVSFSINSVDTVALGLSAAGTPENHTTAGTQFVPGNSLIDVSSASTASTSLAKITSAIEQVAGDRAGYGALQNRLEYTVSNLLNVAEYTTAARSRIEDADFAAESARLAKAQVLQQAGTAMLAQANASSQLALSLFR
jgi:flagellin